MTTTPRLKDLPWSAGEKKIARAAFQEAYRKNCVAIRAEVTRMLTKASDPTHIWAIHDYLSLERKHIDELYDYRYSVLIEVFGLLLRGGWIKKSDLAGLSQDKLEMIERMAQHS